MRYDKLYSIRAQKAVESGLVDVEAFVNELVADGVPLTRINTMLLDDLEGNGPLFGKFFRSIGGAGETTLSVAESQGSGVAEALSLDDELAAFAREANVDGRSVAQMAQSGDPEALELIEDQAEYQELTWICTLRKTCETCLPLHGKSLSRQEWRDRGLRPRSLHPNCECDWVPTELAKDREDLINPLMRNIAAGQEKGGRRTVRSLAQVDIERSQAAAEKAAQSKEGRRILRLLGQSGEE